MIKTNKTHKKVHRDQKSVRIHSPHKMLTEKPGHYGSNSM